MHKIDNWLASILGVFGYGIGQTVLYIQSSDVWGVVKNLLLAGSSAGVGYLVKLGLEQLIKWIRIFIRINRSKKRQK